MIIQFDQSSQVQPVSESRGGQYERDGGGVRRTESLVSNFGCMAWRCHTWHTQHKVYNTWMVKVMMIIDKKKLFPNETWERIEHNVHLLSPPLGDDVLLQHGDEPLRLDPGQELLGHHGHLEQQRVRLARHCSVLVMLLTKWCHPLLTWWDLASLILLRFSSNVSAQITINESWGSQNIPDK